MVTQSINHVRWFLDKLFLLSCFHLNEKGKNRSCSQKNDKQNIKNYRLVSLLPICGKIFERLILTKCLNLFISNNLISHINQLLLIIHEIYKSFDNGLEVRGVFFIYLRLSIKSCLSSLFSNGSKMVFLVVNCTFHLIFCVIKSKEL